MHITIGDGGNNEGLSGLNYNSASNGADPLLHCKLASSDLHGCAGCIPTSLSRPEQYLRGSFIWHAIHFADITKACH